MDVETKYDNLPSDVNTKDKLACLPEEFLSDTKDRPLKSMGKDGTVYYYALKPLLYSVFLILLIEGLERFAYYGIQFSETNYLVSRKSNTTKELQCG